MEIYENLNTCNVLYNRPSCLDKTYATKILLIITGYSIN